MPSVTRPQSYYIYSLTDPRDNSVYYVGQTKNLRNRTYGHMSAGRAKSSGAPVNAKSQDIFNQKLHPVVTELDTITTVHRELALRLEACWIAEMERRGWILYNSWCTGICNDHNNPLNEVVRLKSLAMADYEEISNLRRIESQEAIRKTFGDW